MTGRVWPDHAIGARIEQLRRDRQSGATALSRKLLHALRFALRSPSLQGSGWRPFLEQAARAVRSAQPGMGAFQRWADRLDRASRKIRPTVAVRSLSTALRREQLASSREAARAVRRAVRAFPRAARVLTISRSDLVERTLRGAYRRGRLREVIALESLPGGEGRALVRSLKRQGVPARLVRDRAGVAQARRGDLVLIGADAVYLDGSVVHKAGTRALAMAAHRADVPVYVVTGRSKWVDRAHPPRRLPRRFDVTPGSAIRTFWTDGVMRTEHRGQRKRSRATP